MVALALVTASSCSGASSGGTSHATGPSGIRGTELPSLSCHATADGKALRIAPATVVELRVCPITAPEPFDRPSRPISLTRGSPRFGNFIAALSAPDEAPTKGQLCPEYAELLPQLIASTGSTALLVHVPSDGCGHSLPAARAALNSVIA